MTITLQGDRRRLALDLGELFPDGIEDAGFAGELLVPVDFELWPSFTRFRAGERLRIVMQGSDIYTDSKPNLPFARHENLRNSGHHRILTGGQYDFHLLAPIIPQ